MCVGFGFFIECCSLMLIVLVEICVDYVVLIEMLVGLDWCMVWEGDSMILKGLNYVLICVCDLDVVLVFVIDG